MSACVWGSCLLPGRRRCWLAEPQLVLWGPLWRLWPLVGSFKPVNGGQEGRAGDGTRRGSHSQSQSPGLKQVISPGRKEFPLTWGAAGEGSFLPSYWEAFGMGPPSLGGGAFPSGV